MSSRRSERFTPERGGILVGADVPALREVADTPINPNTCCGRGQGRGGVIGRGIGRGVVTSPLWAQSVQMSSNSNQGRGRGWDRRQGRATNVVTQEELVDVTARDIQATLSNIIVQAWDAIMYVNDGNMVDEDEIYGYSMSVSNHGPSVAQWHSVAQGSRQYLKHKRQGCSFKMFMTCKLPSFHGEVDICWVLNVLC